MCVCFFFLFFFFPPPFSLLSNILQEIDLKAGGGYTVTIGEMCRMMISKLDWFGTLFPRLPVLVQKSIEANLQEFSKPARQVDKYPI